MDTASRLSHLSAEAEIIRSLELFDAAWYLRSADDIPSDCDPLAHYLEIGEGLGRQPNFLFDPAHYHRQLGGRAPAGKSLLFDYVSQGWRDSLSPHPLFDIMFYVREYLYKIVDSINPLLHFLSIGAKLNYTPHPLFSPAFYKRQRESQADDSAALLRDFLERGGQDGASPHPLFDSAFYLARYPDVTEAKVNPLVHYVEHGDREGRLPNRLFDPAFYRGQIEESEAIVGRSLTHYLQHGRDNGLKPHPLFDGAYYMVRYPDTKAAGNPLAHYREFGGRDHKGERRSPHPLFDGEHYARGCRSRPLRAPTQLEDFLLTPTEALIDPHPLFDCAHHRRHVAGGRVAAGNPLCDYVSSPPGSAGNPHVLFDEAYYLAQRPSLAEGGVPLLQHYLQQGYREYLSPHPLFDAAYMHDRYSDLMARPVTPLQSYVEARGRPEFDPNPWFDSISYNLIYQRGVPDAVSPLADFIFWGGYAGRAPDFSERPADIIAGFALAGYLPAPPRSPSQGAGVALYAIHTESGRLTRAHRALMTALRDAGYALVVINSTTAPTAKFFEEAGQFADVMIAHGNGGRDFGSWITAAKALYDELAAFDHVVFVNDSLIGPIGPLAPVWEAFHSSAAPVWGLTDSLEQGQRHIQSSFLILRQAAFASDAFRRFIAKYAFPEERSEVVRQGVLDLCRCLRSGGFDLDVMAPIEAVARAWKAGAAGQQQLFEALSDSLTDPVLLAAIPPGVEARFAQFGFDWLRRTSATLAEDMQINPQHCLWNTLYVDFHYPFLKRDLLINNPLHVPSVLWLHRVVHADRHGELLDMLDELIPEHDFPVPSALRLSRPMITNWRAVERSARSRHQTARLWDAGH